MHIIPSSEPEILTSSDVKRILKIDKKGLSTMIKDGLRVTKIEVHKGNPRIVKYHIRKKDLEDFIQNLNSQTKDSQTVPSQKTIN